MLVTSSTPALAQTSASESTNVLAETLFQQGRALMEAGMFELACPKFAESYRIDRGLGALLNLAVCHERQGRVSSARAEFVEAAAQARRLGDADREALAERRANELSPRVPHVSFQFRPAAAPDTRIVLDGVTLTKSAWESPLAIDPGPHAVSAHVSGKKPIDLTFSIGDGETKAVVLGPFVDETPPPSNASYEPAPASFWSNRNVAAVVTGGAGLVGVGLGTYFGVRTFALKSERDDHCDAKHFCDPRGLELDSNARDAALVSTIAIGVGTALIAVATFLVMTAPPKSQSRAAR